MSHSATFSLVSAEAVAFYACLHQAPVPAWKRVGTIANNGEGLVVRFEGEGLVCAPIWVSRSQKETLGVVRFGVQTASGVRELTRKPITAESWRVSKRIARELAEEAKRLAAFGR